jgi:integrase
LTSSINKKNSIYLKDSTELYENCKTRGMTDKTSKVYRSAVNQYLVLTEQKITITGTYQDFRPSLLQFLDYCRNEKQLSYSALRNHFNGLNNYFAYLKDIGRVSINPIPDFRTLYLRIYKSPDTKEIMQLTIDDIEILLKTSKNRLWRAVISILAFTGMRREELTSLDIGDVDLENRFFYLKSHSKRTNKRIPFTELVLSLVLDYLEIRIS